MMHESFPSILDARELHCECPTCVEYDPDADDRLTARHMSLLAIAAASVTTAVMTVVDPAGTADALLTALGWR